MQISILANKLANFLGILVFTVLLLGCPASPLPPEGMERYEFHGKGKIFCVPEGSVTDRMFPHDALFGSSKTSVITLRLPGLGSRSEDLLVFIGRSTDIINHAYLRDLALFMEREPESVQLDSQRNVYQVDVKTLSMSKERPTLIDRLLPGDGKRIWMVSRNFKALLEQLADGSKDPADIFYARCGADPQGRIHCRRQFPFHLFKGYYVQYPLPENWGKEWFARDKEIRAELSQVAITCD